MCTSHAYMRIACIQRKGFYNQIPCFFFNFNYTQHCKVLICIQKCIFHFQKYLVQCTTNKKIMILILYFQKKSTKTEWKQKTWINNTSDSFWCASCVKYAQILLRTQNFINVHPKVRNKFRNTYTHFSLRNSRTSIVPFLTF